MRMPPYGTAEAVPFQTLRSAAIDTAEAVAFVRRGLQKRLFHKLSTAPVSSNGILYERTSLSG
jgi:hypothetical protein